MKKNIFLSFLFCSFGFYCALNFLFLLYYFMRFFLENKIFSDPGYLSNFYAALIFSFLAYLICLPVIVIVSLIARFVKNIFAEKVLSIIFYFFYGFMFTEPSYGQNRVKNYDIYAGNINWFAVIFIFSIALFSIIFATLVDRFFSRDSNSV